MEEEIQVCLTQSDMNVIINGLSLVLYDNNLSR